jgi:DNA-binding helix-hairpin-helix protein with protein kinase domain
VDGLIQPGQALRMERAGALLTVEKRIGEGGQGVVHAARLNGAPFAVKWFRPGPGNEEMRKSIAGLIQRGRPHPAFVWPFDLVTSDRMPGFGYVMPLLEPRFISLAHLLNQSVQPSFRVITAVGRELVDAFAGMHSAGLCYRDISFGNLRVDPTACEAAIIDVDNVGIDGGPVQVKGTGPFMAPEILRDEALPSTVTDLHSLAVLLFYLLMHGHPLLGMRADASYTWEGGGHLSEASLLVRNFGVEPLFIFDPDDPSNRPVPGDRVVTWWAIYSQQCRRVFTQAFTAGLHDASLNGRVIESAWRRMLQGLHDSVFSCPNCGAAVFYDPEQPSQPCWHCAVALPTPLRLKLPGSVLVLSEGAVVTSHHLSRDRDHRTACAVVEPHPGRPGRVVLRNLTDKTWIVVPRGEETKRVAPSQRLGVRPLLIDFVLGSAARGEIL